MRGVTPGWRARILWFSSSDASRLILTAFAAVIMGLALVLSLSRSGITCFAIAIVVSAWFVARRQTTASKCAVAGAYLAFVLVVAVGWAGVDTVAKRFAAASWDDVGGRLGAWQDTLRIAGDFPLTGIGVNTFGEAIRRRFLEDAEETMSFWLRAGAVTGLVAIALQEFVEFSLQMPGNAVLFTVLAAIAIHRPAGRGSRAGSSRPPHLTRGPADRLRQGFGGPP